MAGHSHWAGIKHKKAIVDAKRGKVFSKVAKLIISAAKQGGGDPDQNLRLKYAIDKAKAANMPKDNIERAIKRGSGQDGADNFEEILYEGYGPGGVGVLVEVLTDNRNRTAPELRKLFEKRGGALGTSGSVSYRFERKGSFIVEADKIEEDELLEIVLEVGAEDAAQDGDVFRVTCDPTEFMAVKEGLEKALGEREIVLESAEIAYIPKMPVTVEMDVARKLVNLFEDLDEHDDVSNSHSDADFPEDVMKELG